MDKRNETGKLSLEIFYVPVTPAKPGRPAQLVGFILTPTLEVRTRPISRPTR